MPFLSIITVNLNNVTGLKQTIFSLCSQTFKDWEPIIIDGGSKDGSVEVIENLRPDYFVSEQDAGMYDAMNKGIRAAKGEWLMFLNSGDYLLDRDVFQRVFSFLDPREADVFYGDIEIKGKSQNQSVHYAENIDMAYWYSANINHQAALYKRSLFEELGLYNTSYRLAADHEFNIRVFCHGKKFKHLGWPLVYYDVNGVSSKNFEQYKKEMKDAFDEWVPAELKRIVFDHKTLLTQSNQSIVRYATRLNNWYQKTSFAKRRRSGK